MEYKIAISFAICILYVTTFSSSFTIPSKTPHFLKFLSDLKANIKVNNSLEHVSDNNYKETAEFLVKSLIPFYIEESLQNENIQKNALKNVTNGGETLQLSENCLQHLGMFWGQLGEILENPLSIINASTWALQMIDSWAKVPTEGMLSGHLNSYGDWDECVNINVDITTKKSKFKGQYCWTYLVPLVLMGGSSEKMNTKRAVSLPELIKEMITPVSAYVIPSVATCVPNSCSLEEVQGIFATLFQYSKSIYPAVSFCNTNEYPPLNTGAIAMISILSVLAFLIILGSVLDVALNLRQRFQELRTKTWIQIILAFSLVTNIKKWQNTSSGEGGFGCIHGMRFFSTCWVLLCHTIILISSQPPSWNTIDINHIYEKHWTMYFILNGYFSVDTFFTMSGLLACYSILKGFQKLGKNISISSLFFILKMYLHRYLRLTPTYALFVGVLANLYRYIGDGPYFNMYAEQTSKSCHNYWWHNLLYINNIVYYNSTLGESMCEAESWYIANDMQFFILAPLFVILLWHWKRIGMVVLGSACIASILTPAIQVGTEKLPPTLIFWKAMDDGATEIYNRPWHRIGPYLVGMWMGYILFKIGKKPVKLSKWAVACGWILSTATALSLILGVIPYYYPDNDDNAIGAAFYAGLSRFSWGIVICWIIFACVKGYGGWINSFLSWKVFIPLGRLTFCVYLSSLSMQMLLQMTIRQPMQFDMYRITNMFFSHVITCFLVGFVFTMTFESPFIALEKILFGRESTPRDSKREVNTKNENETINANGKQA